MPKSSSKTKSHNGVENVIIRPMPGSRSKCLLKIGHLTLQAAWGRSGRTIFKREGDGATPIASMGCLHGYYKHTSRYRVRSKIPMSPILDKMGWCDDTKHPSYNRQITRPFTNSHENMLRQDRLYDFVIVLDWNINCRKRNCGSAIFFHVAKPGFPPTQGCIAISRADMMRILPLINRKTVFKVA